MNRMGLCNTSDYETEFPAQTKTRPGIQSPLILQALKARLIFSRSTDFGARVEGLRSNVQLPGGPSYSVVVFDK
jgi:hypothetical protein